MSETEFHTFLIAADGAERRSGEVTAHFPYWSFTKAVIAICALKLFETGVIDLDARLEGEAYTLRQLLNHTAGLADYSALPEYRRDVAADRTPWPREKLLGAVRTKGPLFDPGKGWAYSNVGYMLAREQIEVTSGLSFARLVTDLVCQPLNLTSIKLATTRDDFAHIYWKAARHYHPGWVYHGCLMGTAQDAAHVLHGLFSGKLLSSAVFQQMFSSHPVGGAIAGRPWTNHGYALGLMTGTMGDSGRAIGHSGGGPFGVNAVYHFPDRDIPVTVACFTEGVDEGRAEFRAAQLSNLRASY